MRDLSRGDSRRPIQAERKLGSPSAPKAPVLFDGKKLATAIYSREELKPGKKYSGPAIITEYSATTVIPPHKHFHLDHNGNLDISVRNLSKTHDLRRLFSLGNQLKILDIHSFSAGFAFRHIPKTTYPCDY